MKKAIRYILLTVCVCVFCYSAYNLINIYLNYKKIDDDYGELAKTYTKEKEEKEENDHEKNYYFNTRISFCTHDVNIMCGQP